MSYMSYFNHLNAPRTRIERQFNALSSTLFKLVEDCAWRRRPLATFAAFALVYWCNTAFALLFCTMGLYPLLVLQAIPSWEQYPVTVSLLLCHGLTAAMSGLVYTVDRKRRHADASLRYDAWQESKRQSQSLYLNYHGR